MAQVKSIKKAQKPQGKCQRCGTDIKAGDPYRYFKVGFRSRTKNVRCMKNECTPRQSELTSSRMSEAYAAQEDAHDAIDQATTVEELQTALEECASRANDLASEYESSIEAAPMLEDQLREKVDALESWASEMEGADWPDEEDAEEQCEHCDGSGQCGIEEDAVDDDDTCADCGASKAEPKCGNCGGSGTIEGEEEDVLEDAKGTARDLVDALEA